MACHLPIKDGDMERFKKVININAEVLTTVKNTGLWQQTQMHFIIDEGENRRALLMLLNIEIRLKNSAQTPGY